jgi:hypothetical protein
MSIEFLSSNRLRRGLACGLAGWIVSFGMTHWGGPMARHLPDDWLHTAAFWGALVSGYILASGFGRAGPLGWVLAAITACLATVFGAIIGGATMALFFASKPDDGAFLGVVAIADAAESFWLVVTWALAMIAVDAHARWLCTKPAYAPQDVIR